MRGRIKRGGTTTSATKAPGSNTGKAARKAGAKDNEAALVLPSVVNSDKLPKLRGCRDGVLYIRSIQLPGQFALSTGAVGIPPFAFIGAFAGIWTDNDGNSMVTIESHGRYALNTGVYVITPVPMSGEDARPDPLLYPISMANEPLGKTTSKPASKANSAVISWNKRADVDPSSVGTTKGG